MRSRKSYRLQGYDYSREGLYFVTICTYEKRQRFGVVENGYMHKSIEGEIAVLELLKTKSIRPNVAIDSWVVMPNHVHMIVHIDNLLNTADKCLSQNNYSLQNGSTLGNIVKGYKASVTKEIKKLFSIGNDKVWQRNYHDHIIRSEGEYAFIKGYIHTNPQRWSDDCYYA